MRVGTRWVSATIVAVALGMAPPLAAADQGRGQAQRQSDKSRKHDRHGSDDARGESQMRFRGMDRNGDGRITRAEWRGNDVSFANHDWDGNGVLEGDEVRPGASGPGRRDRDDRDDRRDRDDRETWRRWDRNGDGLIARAEWRGRRETFERLDVNRDGVLTEAEIRDWR